MQMKFHSLAINTREILFAKPLAGGIAVHHKMMRIFLLVLLVGISLAAYPGREIFYCIVSYVRSFLLDLMR